MHTFSSKERREIKLSTRSTVDFVGSFHGSIATAARRSVSENIKQMDFASDVGGAFSFFINNN